MKAEIGQTDQIFQLDIINILYNPKKLSKLIFEVSHTLSNRFVKLLSRIDFGGRCWT